MHPTTCAAESTATSGAGCTFAMRGVSFSTKNKKGVNYFTDMCSGSEAGLNLRRIDFACHSTLGVSVINKNRTDDLRGRKHRPLQRGLHMCELGG